MTKYTITSFSARNIANIDSVSFETSGDVIITGQNGAGKSTIKKALMWIFNGATSEGEKLINPNFKGLPFVEVTLSDGATFVTFGKEITQKVDEKSGKLSRSTEHYFNGLPAKQKDFQAHFEKITPIFPTMIDLFRFGNLPVTNQRAILLSLFSTVTDAEVKAVHEKFSDLDFKGLTPEQYIKAQKAEVAKLKTRADQIPEQIKTLQSRLEDLSALEEQRAELKAKKEDAETRLKKIDEELKSFSEQLKKRAELNTDFDNVRNLITEIISHKIHFENHIEGLEKRLVDLRRQWRNVSDTCPTCGQKLGSEKFQAARMAITTEGIALKEEKTAAERDLKVIVEQLEKQRENATALNDELEKLNENNFDNYIEERGATQMEINGYSNQIAEINTRIKIRRDTETAIEKLTAAQKENGKTISRRERAADLAEEFIRRKLDMVTAEINSNFKYVGFRMFETLKNGEIKQVCDATLNGVPYDKLSKGETLKASLDVINAFQNHYGVMLPLIIDDAESYTSNTLGNVPNQKILFKVVEGEELTITADEGSIAQCG